MDRLPRGYLSYKSSQALDATCEAIVKKSIHRLRTGRGDYQEPAILKIEGVRVMITNVSAGAEMPVSANLQVCVLKPHFSAGPIQRIVRRRRFLFGRHAWKVI